MSLQRQLELQTVLRGQNLSSKCYQSLELYREGAWILLYRQYRVYRSKDLKVTSFQICRSHKKVCHMAPATLKPVGLSSRWTGVKLFSNFDGR